uniref:GLOBIN domain-containing protein n=1 Tax=Heterorhabditis bacteriophora TaxID=37862 RepID=A0A1I7XF27_HETBA
MVNTELLKKHASQYKITKDTAGEYHKQLFTLHPELAQFYDAEDIDPDSITKVRSKVHHAWAAGTSVFFQKLLKGEEFCCTAYSDVGFPMKEFNKVGDAFLAAMEKNAGGVTAEQKKEWEELFKKAYADMKTWGWY